MREGAYLAYLALILTVPAAIVAFSTLKPTRAVLVMLIGSMMFLPSAINFDPPLIPPLDKNSIPALCMLVAIFVTAKSHVREARIGRGYDILVIGMLLGVFGTTATNTDAFAFGPTKLQALGTSETISDSVALVLGPLAPFIIGRIMFRTAEDAKALLRAFSIGALVYLPFILLERVMSPQMHNWVYGYFPHQFFAQTVREDGSYRPQVFMNHGLVCALFVCTGMLSTWTLVRVGEKVLNVSSRPLAWVLTGLLFVVNSLGAFIYGVLLAPLIRFLKPTTQLRIASVLVIIVLAYPILRMTDLFPVMGVVDTFAKYSVERADSLAFRFENEEVLLNKAVERPWFGWGGWGRSRVFDQDGNDIVIPDGLWVLELGGGGVVRFATEFLLMGLPVLVAARRVKRLRPEHQPLLAGLGMISAIHTVDLLPNAGSGFLYMFLPGAVAGLATGMLKDTGSKPELATLVRALLLQRLARLRTHAGLANTTQT